MNYETKSNLKFADGDIDDEQDGLPLGMREGGVVNVMEPCQNYPMMGRDQNLSFQLKTCFSVRYNKSTLNWFILNESKE